MTKRIVGLLLALCLVVSLMPMVVLAEDPVDPPPANKIKVTTGDITASIVWEPALSEGMTPAYAKTSDAGALILTGASENDYNLKVEWPTGGKPTLILKDATLANNNRQIDASETDINSTGEKIVCPETIEIGGAVDFVVLIKGTNVIKGRHDTSPTTTASYRSPAGIYADNQGILTITGESKADSIHIDNYSGAIIEKTNNDLIIENVTLRGDLHNTGSNAQFGIRMLTGKNADVDKMNLTVRNANLTLEDQGKYYGNNLIIMGSNKGATMEACTGDILFQNSNIRLYRENSTGSSTAGTEIICFGAGSTLTIDRCDVLIYGRHRTMNYWPTRKNVTVISAGDMEKEAGTKITGSSLSKLQLAHVCGTTDDGDCTTAPTCDVCNKALGTAQTAHVPAADDHDCTTAITCANAGCQVVLTPAVAAHVAAADDGDCTTAVLCSNTGCTQVVTAAKPSHTSPASRTDCNQASNCAVCNKALAAGEHTGGAATCKDKAKCELCQAEYGELAAHTGGTATCKDKAVCTVCNQAYGELSAVHVPAEDDGDCTTAVKCSICQAEVVAAKQHTYTNDEDTSCDNAGCAHTRKVSSNPNTGDVSILLTAGIALASAVGFGGMTILRKKEN